MIKQAIIDLSHGKDLSAETARTVMGEIMSGETTPVQISAYLTALAMKGETIDEITGSAMGMRESSTKLPHSLDCGELLEIVGTGGSRAKKSGTFNISTASAIIASAAGIPVAKHGNRSASSKCGSADVLEAIGVKIDISPEKSAELLHKIGICFMFAPTYHTAMKHVAPVRRELGIRTVFNILGPLANPANAKNILLGVYDKSLVEPMSLVLHNLGTLRVAVAHGTDGIDEISLVAPTITSNGIITPEDFGFERCTEEDLTGGAPAENAAILRDIFVPRKSGAQPGRTDAKRNAAVLNAGVAMFVTGRYVSMQVAVKVAAETIDSGAAQAKLEEFVAESNR
jgi:anthranilate phosphoribosyltransferase